MALEVARPAPPSLDEHVDASKYEDADVGSTTDYRRSELAQFLQDGAWEAAWTQWTETTSLSKAEYEIVEELALIEEFDFFWDDFANRVGYHAPGIPEDWNTRESHDTIQSWAQVSNINASLTELGQIVSDVIKADYVDWEADFEAPDDLPDFDTD